jgi:hypothetical protein
MNEPAKDSSAGDGRYALLQGLLLAVFLVLCWH